MKRIFVGLAIIAAASFSAGSYPAWWEERGVLKTGTGPANHDPINQGQLKWLALQAAAEFDDKLPGPENEAIFRMVEAFPVGHDYRPANLGMLKATAQPFYDRLMDLGWIRNYPWEGGTPADFNLANQGQAKNLFAFDLEAVDLDEDGTPDWWQRLYGARTIEAARLPTDTVSRIGSWTERDGLLHALGIDGEVVYTLNLPVAGNYAVEVEGVESTVSSGEQRFTIQALMEGESLGQRSFAASRDRPGTARFDLPPLPAGPVNLAVRWINNNPHAHLALTAVRLVSYATDTWYSRKYEQAIGHVEAPEASYTSPICLEGRARLIHRLQVSARPAGGVPEEAEAVTARRGVRWGWFADVALHEEEPTLLQVEDADSGYTWAGQVEWLAYNLLAQTNEMYTVRAGDSMRFCARPEGETEGQVVIVAQGVQHSIGALSARVISFDAPGEYVVEGTWSNAGQTATGAVTIRVVAITFDPAPAVWVNRPLAWFCPDMAQEVALDHDATTSLRIAEVIPSPAEGRSFLISPTVPGEYALLARLGVGGPILQATYVDVFDIPSSTQTGYRDVGGYYDGSTLVEMLISARDLPEGAQIRARIIIGGLTFEDGTTDKWIGPDDLDESGFYRVRFIVPAGVRFPTCHVLEVWRDGEMLGRR